MKLEEGLYAYIWQDQYENNCNTFVIHQGMTVLIDPGHSRHLKKVFDQMEEDGLSPEGIDVVLMTHSHPDHLESVELFFDKPVKIGMNRQEERYLRENGRFLFEMMNQPMPKIRIDFYLKEGELHLAKEIFKIYETPGHSPGSLSIHWPEKKALFTGDLIFYGGVGRTDFPEGNSRLLVQSIEKMSRLDVEILLPGHGDVIMGRASVLQNFEYIRKNLYPYL